jgi:hypothetical protein
MSYRPLVIALAACLAGPVSVSAQTLAAKPVLFGDPVPGANPRHGELVLGRTTLGGALRIFAVELERDSVRVSLAHEGNPARLPGTEVLLGGLTIHPHHRLDLGPGRYTLTSTSTNAWWPPRELRRPTCHCTGASWRAATRRYMSHTPAGTLKA